MIDGIAGIFIIMIIVHICKEFNNGRSGRGSGSSGPSDDLRRSEQLGEVPTNLAEYRSRSNRRGSQKAPKGKLVNSATEYEYDRLTLSQLEELENMFL